MMNLIPPIGWFGLASKHDLIELEARIESRIESLESRIDGKLHRLRADLMRSFTTWLFASQVAVIASIGLLISVQ